MFQFAEFTIQGYVGKVTITGNVMRLNIGATKSWKDRETGQRNEKTKWNTGDRPAKALWHRSCDPCYAAIAA
ncbi:hypothetical protein [Phaeobacter inhibens]|uniref:hypothetical protein n=1 Tax=Phaeobacter inhibens TaxID=221822 RepID=UPI0024927469|nr:hypothetical protein [Phaeobacter inhibens]